MDLDLQTETGAVIKPVINAAKRTLDTGRVELTENSMRIRGTSPANVSAIDIEIDTSTFDSYAVDPGDYDWDFSALWDVFREGRKSDSYRLYYRDPVELASWETLDDLPGMGRAEREVLEANGITTPEQFRAASPEEIAGTTTYTYEDYKGDEQENTGEIESDDVPGLKRPFDPVIIVEINGDDPIDSDRPAEYPRARSPEIRFDFPDLDTGATVTVNGRDFQRSLRPSEKIEQKTDLRNGTMVFLGATDTDFVLSCEGKTTTAWANPDADIQGGNAGSFYSTECLRSMRLSLDRPASTEVTIELPDASQGSFPLFAEYMIEKSGEGRASVDYFLAPRIRSNNDDDEDEERETIEGALDRLRPEKYSPLKAEKLRATTTGEKYKNWFGVLTAKADEAKIHIRENELASTLVDPANVILKEMRIGRNDFERYRYRSPGGRLGDNEGIVGMPTGRVMDFLKQFRKAETVTLAVDNDARIQLSGDDYTVTLPSIDPDSVRHEPDLPGLELSGRSVVNAGSWTDAISEMDDLTTHVHFGIFNGNALLHGQNDVEERLIEVETVEGDGFAHAIYSMDYLSDFYSAYPEDNGETIEIYAGREFPMGVYHEIHGAEFTMMLAPRISDDGSREFKAALEEAGMDYDRIKNAEPMHEWNPNDSDEIQVDEPKAEEEPDEEPGPDPVEEEEHNVPGAGEKPYDPSDEWNPEAIAKRIQRRNEAHREELSSRTPVIPEDLSETWGTTQLSSGEQIARADAVNPDEEEHFEEVMNDIYDPSDEFKQPDKTGPMALGSGRRRTLEAIEEKDRLGAISNPKSLEDLTDAIREIELDNPRYMTPPEGVIETLLNVHAQLPSAAKPHYVKDQIILRRINAARNQFNDWLGKLRREKEIPSPVEAGPANYPVKKAKDTSRYEREAKQELNERIDKIGSAARGGKQRALEAIGSSVAEFNAEKASKEADAMRDRLEVGDIVQYRDPNVQLGGVVRVNEKSVRVSRANPRYPGEQPLSGDPEPEFIEGRVDLDSNWLEKVPPGELPEFEEFPDTLEEAQMETMGRVVNGTDTDDDQDPEPDTPDTQVITESMVPDEVAGWTVLEAAADKAIWTRPEAGESQNENIEEYRMNVRRFPRQGEGGGFAYQVSTSMYGFDQVNQEEGFVGKTTHKDGGFGGDPEAAINYAIGKMEDRPFDPDTDDKFGYASLDLYEGESSDGPILTDTHGTGAVNIPAEIEEFTLVQPDTDQIESARVKYANGTVFRILEEETGFVATHSQEDTGRVESRISDPGSLAAALDAVETRIHAITDQPDLSDTPIPDDDQADPVHFNHWLEDRGMPTSAALNLKQYYDGPEDLHQAWTAADDPTDLKGVGETFADDVGRVLDEIFEDSAPDVDPDDQDMSGTSGVVRLKELRGIGPATEEKIGKEIGLSDVRHARTAYEMRDERDDWDTLIDLLPSQTAKRSLLDAIDADPDADQPALQVPGSVNDWSLEVQEETRLVWYGEDVPGAPAIVPRDEKVEVEVEVTKSNGEWPVRVIWAGHGPAGIADGVLDVDNLAEPTSKEQAVNRAVEFMDSHPAGKRERIDRDKDPGELPWYARKYLGGAWGQYKGSISDAITAKDTLETEREEAEKAAAEINDIRESYGQNPIDFEGLKEVQETGPSDPVPADIGHGFEWDRSQPYDPSEEFK